MAGITERAGLKRTSMDTHTTSYPDYKSAPGLPDVHFGLAIPGRPNTAAGRYIQHRYRVCTEMADVIATLAGLSGREEMR
jgi:hypothetical protein